MKAHSKTNFRLVLKAVVALAMLIFWSLVVITGLLTWVAPRGQGRGSEPFLAGLTRHDLGDIHLILALITVGFTIIHVIIDWKAFKGLLRYLLTTGHRSKFGQT